MLSNWNLFYVVIQRKNRKDSKGKLSVVKSTYKDADDYFETYEPLLFEEVKAQILQNQDAEEGLIFSSSYCTFIPVLVVELTFSVVFFLVASVCKMRLVMECSEADGFHILLVTYEHEEEEYLAPNDLLLLSIEEVHLLLCCSSSLF